MPRKKDPNAPKLPANRPRAEIDWERVDGYLLAQCKGTEIASSIGVSPDTLYNACQRDHGETFSAYSQRKKERGKANLKVAQWRMALGDAKNGVAPDKGMQIWLGKQYLDQAERSEVKQELREIAAQELPDETLIHIAAAGSNGTPAKA